MVKTPALPDRNTSVGRTMLSWSLAGSARVGPRTGGKGGMGQVVHRLGAVLVQITAGDQPQGGIVGQCRYRRVEHRPGCETIGNAFKPGHMGAGGRADQQLEVAADEQV